MRNLDVAKQQLIALFGERATNSTPVREHHGKCEAWHVPALPDLVCFPKTTEEVAQAVKICAENGVPVVPYGAGSSLEGQTLALQGGVSLDLSQMTRIVDVCAEDLLCTVEAGVTRENLNAHLRDTGLFFPVDPGAEASFGGMCSTRASGTNAVRYGTMRENTLALTVVTPQGEIVKTGTRARKSSAGYDLTHLYVGSEGTLGIITEITLRLHGIPESIAAAVVSLPSLSEAVTAVIETIQIGVPIARIELLDALHIEMINAYSKTDYPTKDTLFVEFHGSESGVQEQIEMFRDIVEANGGGSFEWALREEDRSRLWLARHTAYFAATTANPGKTGMVTDVCVPISKLAESIELMQEEMGKSHIRSAVIGHVGDGNFHLMFPIGPVTELFRSFDLVFCHKGETSWHKNRPRNSALRQCG